MSFIKKHSFVILALGIFALFFSTRFYNILALPIFTDEAIYVRWAQIAGTDPAQKFISLTDGKQPSFVWIAMLLVKFFQDPLLAGRLVSVLAGFGSMIGIFLLASETFKNRKIGILASLIYVLYPFSLIYDRLVLYDSLVAMFMIWVLYFEILLVRQKRLDIALLLGMIIGGGLLTKTSASFALILLPFSLLLFDFKPSLSLGVMNKKLQKALGKWIVLALVSVVVAGVIYSILRLSPYFYIINQKNNIFVYTFSEWIQSPFAYLTGNLRGLGGWLISYISVPFLILAAAAFLIEKKYLKEKLLLLIWFVAPFAALALFGKVIYPRFILFMTMPLLVLGAYSLFNLIKFSRNYYIKALVLIVFLGAFFVKDYFILTDFAKADIPQADKNQFLASWPSGVGVKETVDFLRERSKDQEVYVGTQGTFGLMPSSLEIYLHDNPNVKTQGFWPINDTPPREILEQAAKIPTYFVFYQPCPPCEQTGVAPEGWPLKEVFQIERIEKGSFYTLYQVIPQ